MTDTQDHTPRNRVAIAGVGAMGSVFVERLLRAGFDVIAHDDDARRVDAAVRLGCRAALAPDDEALRSASVVVTSLPSDAALLAVAHALGASPSRSPATVIDTSTLALEVKRRAASMLSESNMVMLDCPVSGTASEAAAGELVLYASGARDCIDACMPVLGALGKVVVRAGPFGHGTRLKFLANLLVGIHTAAAAEMLALAARAGIEPSAALVAVAAGAGGSRMLEVRGPSMVGEGPGAGCALSILVKDLGLIESFAAENGAATPLLAAAAEMFYRAESAGLGSSDAAAVHQIYTAITAEEGVR